MNKLSELLAQFQKAVNKLNEVLQNEKTEIIRDSAIQHFEFTFDLSWKLIKTFLETENGITCVSPKTCFREAYRQALIEYDDAWIEMTDDRNLTAHMYDEMLADTVFVKLPKYLELFQKLADKIAGEIN